ncbi:MAG: hypothetical protein WD824_00315 [Cyclobacteriaceae bacterium]
MWEDDDDNDASDFDPNEDDKNIEALPIYKKALEIVDLTEQIVDTFAEEGHASRHREYMLEDSMMLPAKIAGAEAMDYYIHKMENATLVKIHARSLLTQTASIKHLGIVNEQYVQLLRDEIEAFRLLFKEWVKTFDTNATKEGDGWGLFVPDEE